MSILYDFTCHICDQEFEYDQNDSEGNCPHCGSKYLIRFDCDDPHDAVLIPDFEPFKNKNSREEDEIERKWLMKGIPNLEYVKKLDIVQFYTSEMFRFRKTVDLKTGDVEYYKIKKKSVGFGKNIETIHYCTREEYDIERTKSRRYVHKTRHIYEEDGLTYEIDLMHSPNLVLMEIELKDIDFPVYPMPREIERFIIKEVTGDPAFNNFNLSVEPE